MRHFTTAVLERHTATRGEFATEPYEAAWASEAIFFVRIERIEGSDASLTADVQISADGIHWVDEGTRFVERIELGDHCVKVSHFGGWLRLAGQVDGEDAEILATIQLVLKE